MGLLYNVDWENNPWSLGTIVSCVPDIVQLCLGSPPQSSRVSEGVRGIHIGVAGHWLVAKLGTVITVRQNIYGGPS